MKPIVNAFLAAVLSAAHGDLQEQIDAITRRIAEGSAPAELHLKRGELHGLHRDWEAAQADFDQAARMDPGLSVVDLARARMWLAAGDPAEAKAALDRFLARRPDHADALAHRARALCRLGDRDAAVRDYTRALEKAAEPRVEHYFERAQALAAGGPERLEEAVRGLDEGIRRLGPAVTLQSLAIDLEVAAKRHDAALARLDRMAAAAERKDGWLARRGDILKLSGRMKEAREAFAAALAQIESLPPIRRRAKSTADLERRLRAELKSA